MATVTPLMPTRKVARNSDGNVTMSPAAVTSGAATLSMSQPRRTDSAATTEREAEHDDRRRCPPTIEITRKSASEIVSPTPEAPATALASTARAAETNNVRATAATTFWPTTVSRRRDRRNVPVWIDVPSRLPRAPKMLPRMPMAAGTSTSSPGSSSRVSGDGAEGQPGEEITAGGDEQRRQRLPSPAASESTAARRRATKPWKGRVTRRLGGSERRLVTAGDLRPLACPSQ